jgi:hypothetical protein
MAMLNWNDYRNQILAGVGEIPSSHRTPSRDTALSSACAKTGHLDAKTRESSGNRWPAVDHKGRRS